MNAKNEDGIELGVLCGFQFYWDEDHQKWESADDGEMIVFDQSCTLEYAEQYIEAHRSKTLAVSEVKRVVAEKQGQLEEAQPHRGIYYWIPYSAGVRLADVNWKEFPGGGGLQMLPIDISKLLGR